MRVSQKVMHGLIEVRVTLHSSLSSWDERRPKQTKVKADGELSGKKKRRKFYKQKGVEECELPSNKEKNRAKIH